ncbi:MAG: bifunctional UDP-N-acetylglucosamine diphosphorylase/glucosamine-1-phosphate N-acetyltransferase GlmU [Provencibacterium sp.]|jgi:bifunctional UDP-N-acetylglucosamine pyrophosphorylase/glucosamine-1-phosphate N-acetyltransferase|nr:bifunctional UDP-N-acetylglucosamine diphosphorylase/glucosamine-1-phosphate N-acetyltransferase GlmU [Provencibacterium sp.]
MNETQGAGLAALILAAGNGKRMHSQKPKVLCEVLFKPMIAWIRDWCSRAGIMEQCVVISPEGEEIRSYFPEGTAFAVQQERRGTGHTVMQAMDFLRAHAGGDILVLNGDAPFIDDETIRQALRLHRQEQAAVTIVTAEVEDPTGYGRIVRSRKNVSAIVEHADADDAVRDIREINSGAFWFRTDFLIDALASIGCDNAQGEYYLTDTVKVATGRGERVRAYCSENRDIVLGANDRRGLLKLNEIARRRVFDQLLEKGVNLLCTDGLIVSPDACIEPDATLYPGVIIKGNTRIGAGCVITSGSVVEDSVLGEGVTVNASQIYRSTVGDGARIGPFSHLRPDSHLAAGVKLGDFVEVKNSSIGEKTSVAHLTYVGDSDVGARCNFGCGVVTVNYDGLKKSRNTIGDDVFIGCNTNLVAPVTLGDGAYTAAGSTITEDVPGDALAIARARQVNKPEWSARFRGSKQKPGE